MASHKRSVGGQVKSGLVTACELVGGFIVFVLTMFGLALLIASKAPRPVDYFLGSLALVIATGIIFATAERWAAYIPGFLFLGGFTRSAWATVFPSHGVGRAQAALLAVYSIAVIAMLWRFIPPRRQPATTLDRAALTAFALSFATALVLSHPSTVPVAPLLISLGSLLVGWAGYRWRRVSRGAAQQPAAPAVGQHVRGLK
jgi:hypothetical protein